MSSDLEAYVNLRIAHANAVEWKVFGEARNIANRLDAMIADSPDLEDRFRDFYKSCAARSTVETAEDDMARAIRKHFSGKRVDN